MCKGDKHCNKCKARTAAATKVNKGTVKQFDGRKVVVVPVIMAKADVVMNGGLFPADEYEPLSWAGIPVTVGHPNIKGEFASARDPAIHEEWVVGNLYNVRTEENSLRGDVYVDIEKANAVHPNLVKELIKGSPMDVSTGYFCTSEPETGTLNGREYFEVQRDIIPDHLALLPNEVGACSWQDGCGLRSNLKEKLSMPNKVRRALKVLTNALASDKKSDPVTVDDIIAHTNSPYTEDDRESLSKLSANTLRKIASTINADEEEEEIENAEDEEEEETVNAEGDDEEEVENEEEDEEKPMNKKKNSSPLTSRDREALAVANRLAADHRRSLVQKIVDNSKMTAKDLKDFSLNQLELIAGGMPSGSYAGRVNAEGEADDVADSMMDTGVLNSLRKKSKKEAA
jgi:hypothetical protein